MAPGLARWPRHRLTRRRRHDAHARSTHRTRRRPAPVQTNRRPGPRGWARHHRGRLRRVDDVERTERRAGQPGADVGRPVDRAVGGSVGRRLHRPAGDDLVLDLGRPAGDQEPAGDRRRVPRRQPEHHGQRRRVRLGALLGQAPDRPGRRRRTRRLRDGRPALPRLPVPRRAARPEAVHRRDGYDLGQLADQAVADFTTPDGQFGLPRDLNVVALYYNKKMFDAAGHPVSGRHLGLGQARRGRQEAHPQGRRRQGQPVGPLHRDHRHGELLVRAHVAERRRDRLAPTTRRASSRSDQAAGGIQFLQDIM